MWDNEYYYLVAYDPEEKMIKHYRVDKMLHLSIIDKPREGAEAFNTFPVIDMIIRMLYFKIKELCGNACKGTPRFYP